MAFFLSFLFVLNLFFFSFFFFACEKWKHRKIRSLSSPNRPFCSDKLDNVDSIDAKHFGFRDRSLFMKEGGWEKSIIKDEIH